MSAVFWSHGSRQSWVVLSLVSATFACTTVRQPAAIAPPADERTGPAQSTDYAPPICPAPSGRGPARTHTFAWTLPGGDAYVSQGFVVPFEVTGAGVVEARSTFRSGYNVCTCLGTNGSCKPDCSSAGTHRVWLEVCGSPSFAPGQWKVSIYCVRSSNDPDVPCQPQLPAAGLAGTTTVFYTPRPAPIDAHDSIENLEVRALSDAQIEIAVDYTYDSDHGDSVFLRPSVVQGGKGSNWFGHVPARVGRGSGRAIMRLTFGYNNPPNCVTTDQVRVYFSGPGAPSFHSKNFDYVKTWCQAQATSSPAPAPTP